MLLPRNVRKIFAIFRGEVSPVLILLSVVLGFWFGLTPGWYGVHVILLVLALVLRTNIGIFLLFAALGKALCYGAAPVLFYVGRWGQEVLAPVLNTFAALPVLGLTDFARYSVVGALVIGPLLGLVGGLVLARSVTAFRRAWLTLEENSDAFRKWQSSRWVRLLDWLLLGKRTQDVQAVLKRRSKVINWPGVGIAIVLLVSSAVGLHFIPEERLTGLVTKALSQANGAEVNLARLDLAALSGRVTASGIQATDPENPSNNRIAVSELTADVNVWDLLRGKLVLDNVGLAGVEFDEPRDTPGVVLVPPEKAARPKFDPTLFDLPKIDVHQLQAYFEDAETISAHLQQIDAWLAEGPPEPPAPQVPQNCLEYLSARAPVSPTPRILIRRAVLNDMRVPLKYAGLSTVTCTNLNDAPHAAALPVTIALKSQERPSELQIVFHHERSDGGIEITGSLGDVDLKELQASLSRKNPVRFEGGTATAHFTGDVSSSMIDIAIQVETRGMRAGSTGSDLFGLDPRVTSEVLKVLENLKTNLRLVGPITAPRLVFDVPSLEEEFKEALVRAGKEELARRVQDALGDKLPGDVPEPDALLKDPIGAAGDALGNLLNKKTEKDQAEPDEKEKEDEQDQEGEQKEKEPDDLLKRLKEKLKKKP